jgi:macrophage erythroblast attacher
MQGLGGEGNPLGHPALCRIAERLPYSKRTVSKLVCPITGKIMEGSNAPLVLPNGYVYGEDAIRAGFLSLDNAQSTLGASDDDYPIQCPITKDIFSIKDARRAYIV